MCVFGETFTLPQLVVSLNFRQACCTSEVDPSPLPTRSYWLTSVGYVNSHIHAYEIMRKWENAKIQNRNRARRSVCTAAHRSTGVNPYHQTEVVFKVRLRPRLEPRLHFIVTARFKQALLYRFTDRIRISAITMTLNRSTGKNCDDFVQTIFSQASYFAN